MGNLSSLSELVSAGKSGSFFYYSDNGILFSRILIFSGKFLMKTIPKREFETFLIILKKYYTHIMNYYHTMVC